MLRYLIVLTCVLTVAAAVAAWVPAQQATPANAGGVSTCCVANTDTGQTAPQGQACACCKCCKCGDDCKSKCGDNCNCCKCK